eukprot:4713707-Pleurochrysis_carterae.AAC.1
MRRCPLRRCLLLRAKFRRTRDAVIARAHVANGADIRPWGTGGHTAALALDGGADVALGVEQCEMSRGTQSASASGTANAAS